MGTNIKPIINLNDTFYHTHENIFKQKQSNTQEKNLLKIILNLVKDSNNSKRKLIYIRIL